MNSAEEYCKDVAPPRVARLPRVSEERGRRGRVGGRALFLLPGNYCRAQPTRTACNWARYLRTFAETLEHFRLCCFLRTLCLQQISTFRPCGIIRPYQHLKLLIRLRYLKQSPKLAQHGLFFCGIFHGWSPSGLVYITQDIRATRADC